MNSQTYKKLKTLIANSEIDKALEEIGLIVENDDELEETWILINGRWEQNERKKRRGTILDAPYDTKKNEISQSLLSFIEEANKKYKKTIITGSKVSIEIDLDKHFLITSYLKKSPAEVWDNFVMDFKSYNDSWMMEDDDYDAFVETHKKRYNDPDCGHFSFLFFPQEGNHSNWSPFIRFAKFQAFVHFDLNPIQESITVYKTLLIQKLKQKPFPETLNFISVYLNMRETPQQTFFRGYKHDENGDKQKVSIWYLKLNNDDEKPELILKTANDEFWKDLNDKWNKSKRNLKPLKGKKIFEKLLELLD